MQWTASALAWMRKLFCLAIVVDTTALFAVFSLDSAQGEDRTDGSIVDLSLTVSPEYPCTWPQSWPFFQINHYRQIGPLSAYNSDILVIDPNTGTQLDVPAHSIARPGFDHPTASRFGSLFADKISAWQYGGEACVIDIRPLLDSTPRGVSPLVRKEHIMAWEREHRPLGDGDVVLLYSGYSDEYYKPLPKGRRFIADPVAGKTPAWPGPHPDCMEYMVKKNVMHVVTDSPSIGPMPDLGEPTHVAGLKYGAIFTEGAIGLHQLPPTGAFYCCVGPRHAMSPCSEARAFAILDEELAGFLISATRKKRVTDLSVVLAADLPLTWPGSRVGSHRQPYYAINILYASAIDVYQHTHMLDSNSGTHLVPPAFALPSDAFDDENYAPDVKAWLGEYVKKYGPRETSELTTEKIPLSQTMGWARVIDVTGLIGTTSKDSWPASPEITVAHIQKYEQQHGALRPNEIVLFRTSHVDRTYSRKSKTCMDEPLSGEAEGWPAPGPDAIRYLSQRGIRCVGTDAPSLGSVDPKSRLFTYWALTSQTMVGVEFLTNLANVPERAYFVFAPIKIKDCHGGPGRAVVYY